MEPTGTQSTYSRKNSRRRPRTRKLGYKYNDKSIKCPNFKRVTRSTHGQLILICCMNDKVNLGYDVSPCMRFTTTQEMHDYIEVMCEDCYESCPIYKTFGL